MSTILTPKVPTKLAPCRCWILRSDSTALTAPHTGDRHRRQGPADRVDEQRARPGLGRELPVKNIDGVGEAIPVKLRIANGHRHFFGGSIPILQEGNNRVGRVFGEAVFAVAPLADELLGAQVAHDSLRPVGKEQGRVCQPVKCHGAVARRQPMGTLHKQCLDLIDLLVGIFAHRCVPFAYKSAPRTSWKHVAPMVIRYQINSYYCTLACAVDWKPRCLHTRPYRGRLL